MDCYIKQLNERYLLPFNLSLYGKVHSSSDELFPSIEIYSSPKIEEIIKNRANKSTLLNPIKDTVITALNNKKLIVGYVSKNKYKFIYNKIIKHIRSNSSISLGFYDYLDDTIFILLDENVNIFGKDISSIDNVIAHEFCHMAARHFDKTNFFKELNKPFIYPYYLAFLRYLYRNLFSIEKEDYDKWINNTNTQKYIVKLLKDLQTNEDITNRKKRTRTNLVIWTNFFLKSSNNFFTPEQCSENARMIIDTYLYQLIEQNYYPEIEKIQRYLLESYKKIGMTKYPYSFTGQELIMPSEIICVSNQNGISSLVAKCINKIPM